MNTEERLAKYLDELEKALDAGAAFVANEAPMVVQEYLQWEFYSSMSWMIASGALSIFLLFLVVFCGRYIVMLDPKHCGEEVGCAVMCLLLCCGIFLVSSGVAINYGVKAAKVKIAPRVVLLEKLSTLIRK